MASTFLLYRVPWSLLKAPGDWIKKWLKYWRMPKDTRGSIYYVYYFPPFMHKCWRMRNVLLNLHSNDLRGQASWSKNNVMIYFFLVIKQLFVSCKQIPIWIRCWLQNQDISWIWLRHLFQVVSNLLLTILTFKGH